MKKFEWELVGIVCAVGIAFLGVIYTIGKKEGTITAEVQQNRRGIDRLEQKLDDVSAEMRTYFRDANGNAKVVHKP